ncbi:MAG: hypothetical protein IPK07_29725 [Deltaproteobacteria bacterium]|nr:hypothetical protein [Deltaproteobacteria bacterium]
MKIDPTSSARPFLAWTLIALLSSARIAGAEPAAAGAGQPAGGLGAVEGAAPSATPGITTTGTNPGTSGSEAAPEAPKHKKKAKAPAPPPLPVLDVAPAEPATLTRTLEPLVLRAGVALPGWLGSEIGSIRAYALVNGKLQPVPFQVDERAADGRYLYPDGIRNDAVEIDGKLTAEDELVLLASDAGARPPDGTLVPGAADTQLVAIEDPAPPRPPAITPPPPAPPAPAPGDAASTTPAAPAPPAPPPPPPPSQPTGPTHGWFVLARYDGAPPDRSLVTQPRMVHEWDKNYVYSSSYGIGFYDFVPPAHSAVPREIRLRQADGAGPNILDRFKWRVEISVLWGLYTVRFDEQNVRVQVLAYKIGPVRTLRYVACRVVLPFGIDGPSLTIDAAFYPTMAQIPLELTVPHSPGFIGTHSDLILGVDLSPNAQGMLFYDSENPDGFLVDGWMSETEKAQRKRPDQWRLWAGKQGSLVERTFWDPAYLKTVGLEVEYVDDAADQRPPEEKPGQHGAYFERYRVDDLAPGTYRALMEWYFPGWYEYTPGDESAVLAVRDQPLRVRVGDWEGPALPPPPR